MKSFHLAIFFALIAVSPNLWAADPLAPLNPNEFYVQEFHSSGQTFYKLVFNGETPSGLTPGHFRALQEADWGTEPKSGVLVLLRRLMKFPQATCEEFFRDKATDAEFSQCGTYPTSSDSRSIAIIAAALNKSLAPKKYPRLADAFSVVALRDEQPLTSRSAPLPVLHFGR